MKRVAAAALDEGNRYQKPKSRQCLVVRNFGGYPAPQTGILAAACKRGEHNGCSVLRCGCGCHKTH